MKLPNGLGSVYKLKDAKRRRPWVAMITAGFDSKGKQKRSTLGYYAKREEAEEAIAEWRKRPTSKLDMTLEDIYKEWKEPHFRNISKSTSDGYKAAWLHLAPIKNEKVRNLRTAQMQDVMDNVRIKGKPPSRSSLEKIKALMTLLLDYAIKNDIIATNYAEFIKLPKKEKSTRTAYTDTELTKVEKAVSKVPNADTILVLCYTGFRLDEFLSLTKFSI